MFLEAWLPLTHPFLLTQQWAFTWASGLTQNTLQGHSLACYTVSVGTLSAWQNSKFISGFLPWLDMNFAFNERSEWCQFLSIWGKIAITKMQREFDKTTPSPFLFLFLLLLLPANIVIACILTFSWFLFVVPPPTLWFPLPSQVAPILISCQI